MSKLLTIATISVTANEQDQIRQVVVSLKDPAVSWEWSADAARADVIIIDADSMYGHMDWLRAQSQGRNVICLTASTGHEQDNVLHRPIGVGAVRQSLARAAQRAGIDVAIPAMAAAEPVEVIPAKSEPVTPIAPMPVQTAPLRPKTDPNQRAVPAAPIAAPTPAPLPVPPIPAPAPPAPTPAPAAVVAAPVAVPSPAQPVPAPAPTPAQVPAVPAAPAQASRFGINAPSLLPARPTTNPNQRAVSLADAPPPVAAAPVLPVPVEAPKAAGLTLADYCVPDNMARAAKIERPGLPPLVLDAAQDRYYAGLTLKPLLGYCQGEIAIGEWKPLTDAETEKFRSSNSGLPLSRLLWLYVLGTSNGLNVLPGLDGSARFKLTKWPQIEREFPKHFRIATAMMKGFAPLTEVADGSGATLGEVVDFVNAYAAIGFVQQETGNFNFDRKSVLDRLRQRSA